MTEGSPVDSSTEGRPTISATSRRYGEVLDFLYLEAELLDDRRHREWLSLLTDDVRYVAPVRVTSPRTLDDSTLDEMAHFDEDRYSLTKRVERFETEYAGAEEHPSRTRRFVNNVRCWEGDDEGAVLARSSLLLFRSRGDVDGPDLLSARRTDLLRSDGDGFKLARREILLDESVLRTQNLAIFL